MALNRSSLVDAQAWREYICRACGHVYSEELGDPDSGIAPGTRFEDIPDDWVCPLCGVMKADFELLDSVPAQARGVDRGANASLGSVRFVRSAGAGRRGGDPVVVVGAGLAGWAVVEQLRARDPDLPIVLVSACAAHRYSKPELSVAMRRGLDRDRLVREQGADAESRLGIELMAHTRAIGLSPALHQLRTTRGSVRYRALVIAQGARARLPSALNASDCWRINDLDMWSALHERLQGDSPRRIAIVGAGMVGCELADDLRAAGHTVHLVEVGELPLPGLLPPLAGEQLRDGLSAAGVDFIASSAVQSLQSAGARDAQDRAPRQLLLRDADGVQTTLVVDEVIAATGLETDLHLARSGGLSIDRGIRVDEQTLRTSAEDVYAIGDCASHDGIPYRFIEPLPRHAGRIADAILSGAAQHGGAQHGAAQHGAHVGRAEDRIADATTASAPHVIRLKTSSVAVELHGLPSIDGQWRRIEDLQGQTRFEQSVGTRLQSTLRLGQAR